MLHLGATFIQEYLNNMILTVTITNKIITLWNILMCSNQVNEGNFSL